MSKRFINQIKLIVLLIISSLISLDNANCMDFEVELVKQPKYRLKIPKHAASKDIFLSGETIKKLFSSSVRITTHERTNCTPCFNQKVSHGQYDDEINVVSSAWLTLNNATKYKGTWKHEDNLWEFRIDNGDNLPYMVSRRVLTIKIDR